jgi:hypothetical protein
VNRADVFTAIMLERARQGRKWSGSHDWGVGDCSGRGVAGEVKLAVLGEEFGEVARALLDKKPAQLRKELVQVAAVAVAWLESIETEGVS